MRFLVREFRPAAILAAIAVVLLATGSVFACKYSVRDVGFVDLDAGRYRLVLCDRQNADPARLENLREAVEPLLRDSNISVEPIDEDSPSNHPVLAFLRERKRDDYPTAVLIGPDGRQLEMPKPDAGADSARGNWTESVMQVVRSPIRERILERALLAHSIVLVVEGIQPENNQRAHAMAEEAVETIRRSMKSLPKPVGGPPEVLVLPANQRPGEAVLLWSLGIQSDDPSEAHIAVLFGRGRLTGSPLTVPGGTATELVGRLEYVGRDCECELDRSWMQGAMFPHRWDLSLQEESTQKLGFDPDSPLVKYDMQRILARGETQGRRNLNLGNSESSDPVLGYSEMTLPDIAEPPEEQLSKAVPSTEELGPEEMSAPPPPAESEIPAASASISKTHVGAGLSPLQTALIAVGILGLVAVAGGGIILMRSRRA